jgi:hypothetical protein
LTPAIETTSNFLLISFLDRQINRLFQHAFGFLDRFPLTCDTQLRTRRYEPVILALDHRGEFRQFHENQRPSASFAFATASSSVSPALAQPGNSGKTADQRFASGSNSTITRSFMT